MIIYCGLEGKVKAAELVLVNCALPQLKLVKLPLKELLGLWWPAECEPHWDVLKLAVLLAFSLVSPELISEIYCIYFYTLINCMCIHKNRMIIKVNISAVCCPISLLCSKLIVIAQAIVLIKEEGNWSRLLWLPAAMLIIQESISFFSSISTKLLRSVA